MTAPLILTLALDRATFARFDAERRALFPDRRYRLPAHLTLFHALPGDDLVPIGQALLEVAARTPPLPLRFAELMDLRPGVAYRVRSEALDRLRADLAVRWQDCAPTSPSAGRTA
ncbi:2'-5' RNA ligase family protein [Wenxinia marina]|uniref:2'-5' RNA ligase superfamily n=1 Tax=Wenxinia marina DSM 24838 TaxID=1123501 RepID=A0A0D0NHL5_9RHOB|nr:2'-5' RNA ligase family protein [Wenxinia marina]KIQ67830.1 2'-5' RNA ligase superfamily [Wenxinia marina DSM 24838]